MQNNRTRFAADSLGGFEAIIQGMGDTRSEFAGFGHTTKHGIEKWRMDYPGNLSVEIHDPKGRPLMPLPRAGYDETAAPDGGKKIKTPPWPSLRDLAPEDAHFSSLMVTDVAGFDGLPPHATVTDAVCILRYTGGNFPLRHQVKDGVLTLIGRNNNNAFTFQVGGAKTGEEAHYTGEGTPQTLRVAAVGPVFWIGNGKPMPLPELIETRSGPIAIAGVHFDGTSHAFRVAGRYLIPANNPGRIVHQAFGPTMYQPVTLQACKGQIANLALEVGNNDPYCSRVHLKDCGDLSIASLELPERGGLVLQDSQITCLDGGLRINAMRNSVLTTGPEFSATIDGDSCFENSALQMPPGANVSITVRGDVKSGSLARVAEFLGMLEDGVAANLQFIDNPFDRSKKADPVSVPVRIENGKPKADSPVVVFDIGYSPINRRYLEELRGMLSNVAIEVVFSPHMYMPKQVVRLDNTGIALMAGESTIKKMDVALFRKLLGEDLRCDEDAVARNARAHTARISMGNKASAHLTGIDWDSVISKSVGQAGILQSRSSRPPKELTIKDPSKLLGSQDHYAELIITQILAGGKVRLQGDAKRNQKAFFNGIVAIAMQLDTQRRLSRDPATPTQPFLAVWT